MIHTRFSFFVILEGAFYDMLAYPDYNIFISLERKELQLEQLIQLDTSIKHFPFSASHIQEADNINSTDRDRLIETRLQTIRKFSGNKYLYHDLSNQSLILQEEDPQVVLETIRDVPFGKNAMQLFTSLFSDEVKQSVRNSLGIDPKE